MAIKYKKTITIDRSKWCRGGRFAGDGIENATDHTALLTTIKNMCCLGFFCHQAGVPKKSLLGIGTPEAIPDKYHDKITALVDVDDDLEALYSYSDSAFTNAAIEINDSTKIDEPTRESKLKKLFAENGYRIVFVGCTPKE